MKIRLSLTAPLALILALTIAACGSNSPAVPSIAIPGGGGGGGAGQTIGTTGTECAAYPKINLAASPQPSMPVDSSLLSEFPTQVAGQNVTDVQAVPYLAFICALAGQTAIDSLSQESTVLGVNIATMSFGNFTATVNNNEIKVTALRTPNQDASQLISKFGLLGGFVGASIAGAGLSDANLGGKNVKVSAADASSGSKSYFYAHGDTLFTFDDTSDDEAATVLQALP